MPLYEYQCRKCGRFEVIQKFSDAPLATCPTCQGEVQKMLSAPAIQFKGTGWYVTDYARKPPGGSAKKDGDKGPSGDKGDSASSTPDTTSSSKDSAASGSTPTK